MLQTIVDLDLKVKGIFHVRVRIDYVERHLPFYFGIIFAANTRSDYSCQH